MVECASYEPGPGDICLEPTGGNKEAFTILGPMSLLNELGMLYEPGGGLSLPQGLSGFHLCPKPIEVALAFKVDWAAIKSLSCCRRGDLNRESFEKLQPTGLFLRSVYAEFPNGPAILIT